jgi:DNA-binding LacI/PurR family transcriptional regulator
MIVFEKDKAYMELLCAFRRMINIEFQDGGWFPSRRQLGKRFNISSVTCVKTIKRLVAEGVAVSFPRKGIYIIPNSLRPKKIGLVIGNGEESPFLTSSDITQSILRALDQRGYWCQMIQGSSGINIVRSAISHCVSGVVWLLPQKSVFDTLKDISINKFFPLICVQGRWPTSEDEVFQEDIAPNVVEDYLTACNKLAEPFIARGHKKIAWAASPWYAEYVGFGSTLRNAGLTFDDSYCVADHIHNPGNGNLTKLVMQKGVTGIILHGLPWNIEFAFKELSALPDESQPEVLVWDNPMLTETCSRYPAVKIIAIVQRNEFKFGKAAVDMLLGNLNSPENITSVKVKAFQVNRTDKFYDMTNKTGRKTGLKKTKVRNFEYATNNTHKNGL